MIKNKAILGILAAAIVATGKSVSAKKQHGSFGKKRNKTLEAFQSWVNNYISEACEDTYNEFDLGREGLPVLTLNQAIESLRDADADYVESFCNFPKNCPEAYAYASLIMGLSADGVFGHNTSNFLSHGIEYGVEFEWSGGKRFLVDESNLRDFYSNALKDIENIRSVTGYSDEIATEHIIKRNLSFFVQNEDSYQIKLFPQLQELQYIEIEQSILSTGIHGFIIVKYLECIISMVFDKNLAEAVKSYYIKLAQQKKIYVGKHPSYNVDLLIIGQRTVPTKIIFMSEPSRLYISRFIGKEYVGQILGRIKEKLSRYVEPNTMAYMLETFNDFDDVSVQYRNKIRVITQPRPDETNMKEFCMGFLSDLHELSVYPNNPEISLRDTEVAWDTLEQTAGTFTAEDDAALDLYFDLTTMGEGAEIKGFLDQGVYGFDRYCYAVALLESNFSEAGSGRLDATMSHWVNESIDLLESELKSLSEAYRIGESSISVNPQDQVVMQLPISDVQQMPLSEQENISRVILVEYKNPKTLTSITHNTVGALCVGRDTMSYKRRLLSGEQRHFGVLAQKQDGELYVMYHTHSSGGVLSDFTDAKNVKKTINAFPRHHQNLLNIANQKIKELIQ